MHIDEATLRRLYLEQRMTVVQIARTLHVRTKRVCDSLKHYGISPPQPPPRPRRCPDIDAAALRQLYLDKRSTIREIADAYQVSYHTVRTALIQAGISRRRQTRRRDRPPLPPDVLAEIKERVTAYGVRRTARLLGITPQKLYALSGERPRRRGRYQRLDDTAVRAAYEGGMTTEQVAAQWGCSPRSIQRSLERTLVRPADGTPLPAESYSDQAESYSDQNDAKLHETAFHEV